MAAKKDIRKKIFALRKKVTDAQVHEKSLRLLSRILETEEYQKAERIFCYVDFNHEAETKDLILRCMADGKQVAVPKVVGKDMDFYHLLTFDQLEPGYFGIPEPVRGDIVVWEDALMFVPGVAFDAMRHRAGYGQGFYDRYLEKHDQHPTIALALDFQIVDCIDTEPTDICPDMVMTELRTIR